MRVKAAALLGLLACLSFGTVALVDRYSDDILKGHIDSVIAMCLVLAMTVALLVLVCELGLCLAKASPTTTKRWRLLLGSLAIALVAAELGLRLLGLLETWQESNGGGYVSAFGQVLPNWVLVSEPNVTTVERKPEFAYELRTNAEGLRDVDHSKKKTEGELRILVLGDSFAEGVGATAEESWPKQLERRLSGRYPERTITTINAGVSGSDPWFEYVLLEKRLLEYGPDLVIVALNSSDIFDLISRGGAERFRSDGTVRFREGPAWEWLYASSHFVRLVVHVVLGYNSDLVRRDAWQSVVQQMNKSIYTSLLEFRNLAEIHGFRLIVVIHPHFNEILDGRAELGPLVGMLRRETDIQVVDVLEHFVRGGVTRENVGEYYWEQDGHHNAKGYGLLAQAVEADLVASDVLDPPR